MARVTVNKLRWPIGRVGGEAASFVEDGSGAPPARPVVDSGDPRLDRRDARVLARRRW